MDAIAVPVIIHRNDLREIALLWLNIMITVEVCCSAHLDDCKKRIWCNSCNQEFFLDGNRVAVTHFLADSCRQTLMPLVGTTKLSAK